MLVQFSVENFQSIKNRVVLDMRKVNINEHSETLIEEEYLPVSVLYGPNGGGKSTILRAMSSVFSIITTPLKIVSNNPMKMSTIPTFTPIPFMLDKESREKPTVFEIVIKIGAMQYRLCMELLKGAIIYESLQEKGERGKPSLLYKRENNKVLIGEKLKGIPVKDMIIASNIPAISSLTLIYNISPFKEIAECVLNWSAIDYSQPAIEEYIKGAVSLSDRDDNLKQSMKKMLNYLNLGIDDFELEFADETKSSFRVKTFHKMPDDTYNLLLTMESMGTQKIFNLMPFIVMSLRSGGVLVVDELDAKIHPKMLERIVGLFTDKENNPNGAQLIFTSHDLSTMKSEVFRRDEIWFAAKDEEESTLLYSLADLKGLDGEKIRSDASYSKQYLAGRYGADPYFNAFKNWEDCSGKTK
ncbi:MAG: ATP-binding protein [Clostridia bacterium]|nr:ATP-binding protein [Clostridia bacterium]